jgi:hypothetical protein
MIASLTLLLAVQVTSPAIEFIDARAKFVSVQAIVKLPPMGEHEMSQTKLLAEIMADEVEGYSRTEMRNLAGRAGESLRITVMPDHLRIQIGVVPSDLKPAITYVQQILRNSRLSTESLNRALAEVPYRTQSLWASALQPFKYKFMRIRRDDIVELYHRLCRPDNVWLAVGGPLEPHAAADFWAIKTKGWSTGKLFARSLSQSPPEKIGELPGRESMVELRGREVAGGDPALSSKVLAVIALGCGKGSAMFERLRDSQAWSYRQEALLWPSAGGFTPRLIMATGDKTPLPELGKSVRAQLLDAVKSWTESDIARARGLAEGIFLRGLQLSPFYFNPSWPVGDSLHDRTFMSAYWQVKTGHSWEPSRLLGEMALLKSDEVKEVALELLNGAELHAIPARG